MSTLPATGPLSDDAPAAPVRTACARPARVVDVRHVCREHVVVEMAVGDFPPSAPGQFLQVVCHEPDATEPRTAEWADGAFPAVHDADFNAAQPFLRRPFSIADRRTAASGETRLEILSRAVGIGTRWLDRLRRGTTIDITGPLGHGFDLPPAGTPLALVGGGVGIPPLLYLTRVLRERGERDVTLIVGARSSDLLPLAVRDEPRRDGHATPCVLLPGDAGYACSVASDDGTIGLRGLTTDALLVWAQQRGAAVSRAVVMACGPDAMLRAVARQTRALGLACQLCIERNMGCGLGTCLSCVVRLRAPQRPQGWRWALACSDGPVFARDALPDYD